MFEFAFKTFYWDWSHTQQRDDVIRCEDSSMKVIFFTDEDSTIRSGVLRFITSDDEDCCEEKFIVDYVENHNGLLIEKTIDADGVYYAPIKIRSKYFED